MNSLCLGVDVGGTNIKLALLDGGSTHELPGIPTDGAADASGVFAALRVHLEKTLPSSLRPIVGLSVAGLVTRDGVVAQAPNLPRFVQQRLPELWRSVLPYELAVVENDVHCAMYGELALGAARDATHAVMLSLGTGVGGGAVIEGNLLHGSAGFGAELGHLILDPDGPPCTCGKSGHVESYLSSDAIVATARARLQLDGGSSALSRRGAELSVADISAAAHAGDELAIEVLADRGFYLGLACTQLAHAFNPQICVIGGGVAGSGEYLLEPARRTLRERAMEAPASIMTIVAAELGTTGAAQGAALLAAGAG